MDVQFGPNSVDEPNLLYKLQRKLKVFNTNHPLPNRGYNLVTSSSKYGLVFVASPDQILSVYYLKHIIDKECTPQHAKTNLVLNAPPTHIAVSCDQELLAVTGGQVLCVYRVTDFQNQYVSPSFTVKCDVNQSTFVSAMQWNPCMPDTIALAFFDGTLIVCQAASNNTKKVQSKARCLCWSPKGKQLVTGNLDGTLSQFKPDLTPAKMIAPPNLFEGSPVEALAIYWISTFQFAVVYKNATNNSRPAVTIVNTPKAGQPTCLNYEDICYSMGSNRPWYYYLHGLAQWNIIMSSSSNSMEIATVGSVDGTNWSQWCQSDEARPELPLTDKKQENYPVGICLDICAIHQLPWGENDTLPHMPLLLVLSQTGLLTVFNVINLKKDAPQLCIPPHQIALPAVSMSSEIPGAELVKAEPAPAAPAPVARPVLQPQQTMQPQPIPQPRPIAQPQPTPQPQPIAQPLPIAQPQSITPASQGFTISGLGGVTVKPQVIQAQPPQNLQPATILQVPQVKPAVRPQPQPQQQTQPTPQIPVAQPKPQVAVKTEPSPQQQEASAALKAEQQRANRLKAEQELRNMLLNEVNDFQMEVYSFVAKTRVEQNRLAKQLNAMDGSFCLPSGCAAKLRAACALDELRAAAVELKLELVRACAVVAEARTHAEAKEQHQWSQADPLTLKRVSSVKKLAYYVQTQLEQAHRALESRWDDKDSYLTKSGSRMTRPLLDDVYQPLVRQQQILARQAGALRALRAGLPNTANTGPLFQSHTLLRDTPFKKKDPLSKLTKNILNMSLESQTNAPKESVLSAQKLDALRDMLANHKPTKIKSVNIEFHQQLAAMTLNYEKSREERAQSIAEPVKINLLIRQPPKEVRLPTNEVWQSTKREPKVVVQLANKAPQSHPFFENQVHTVQPGVKVVVKKPEPKPDLISKPQSLPSSFTPVANVKPTVPGIPNVARTLFTEEPRQEQPAPPATRGQGFALSSSSSRQAFEPTLTTRGQGFEPASTTRGQGFEPASTTRGQGFEPTLVTRGQGFEPTPATRGQGFEPTPATRGQGFEPAPSSRGQAIASTPAPPAAAATRSVLKDMLQSRTLAASNASNNQSAPSEQSDANTFMGQKICSPTAFSTPASQAAAAPQAKPISDINNMFNKFAPQQFAAELKPQAAPIKPKSDETGEPEASGPTKPVEKKETSPFTDTFTLKQPKSPLSGASNEPDILKTNFSIKSEPRDDDKTGEKSKENIPSRSTENVPVIDKRETGIKHFSLPVFASGASSIPTSVTAAISSAQLPEVKTEPKETPTEPQKDKPVGSSASSLFSAANASSAKPSIFGASLPSPTTTPQAPSFGSTTSPPVTTAEKPIDLSDTATTKSASLLFGSAVASQPTFGKPASGSIFASTTTAASTVFGSPKGSIFGSTAVSTVASEVTTTNSAAATFPVASAAPAITTPPASPKPTVYSTPKLMPPSLFAVTTTAPAFPASPTSVFAAATTASVFGSSVFGSPTTTGQSLFGATTSTSQSVFGTPATTSQSLFGGSSGTTQPLFGNTTTTTQSVFGASTATTQASSIFSQANQSVFSTPTTTQASVFGATTQASVFGSPTTTQASVFGAPATTQASVFGATATTQASVFGAPATTQASVFGAPQTTQASVFGSPQTAQASVFGSPTTTTASGGSLFGGAEGSLFAAASISTTSASSPSGGGGNIFGGGTPGSVFGGGSPNVFGAKTTFGQNNTAASIFGSAGAGATGFGQKPAATDFWSGGNAAGNAQPATGFGSGFGQQPTTQASSIFGGGQGGSFSQPSGGQPFGSPQPSVFGAPQQQTGASGFGGSPVFASKPGFGQTASFGGSAFGGGFNKSPSSGFGGQAAFGGGATFGGGAAFGSTSPAKLFSGAAAASPGFGAPAPQANATFESMATQNTLTFGNLAQTAQQPPQQPQPFSASPSFTGWRG